MGRTRPATQMIVGLGLIGAGLLAKRNNRRTILYRGTIEPGSGTHIKVYRGSHSIHDGPIGG